MKRTLATLIAAGATLAACGAAEPGEAAGGSGETATSSAAVDLSDALITCAMPDYDDAKGITVTQSFILLDGKVKRYSGFNNTAFDLCEAGQEDCSLAVEGGAIRMDWTSQNGVRSRYDVDLDTLKIAAYVTKDGEAERPVAFKEGAKCTREPLPEDLKVL